jgi:hypothetical protein
MSKQRWLFRHIGRMMGTYIAATTAFLVVNIHSDIRWLPWLIPTFIGTPLIFYFIYTFKSKAFVSKSIVTIFLLMPFCASTQAYISGGKTRHRFAQLTLGIDTRLYSSFQTQTTTVSDQGVLQQSSIGNSGQTRLQFGGTHFWGHADFYVAIPIIHYGDNKFSSSVETGARYFPWRIENKKLRPFIGICQLPVIFKQGEGVSLVRFRYPLSVGAVFNYKKHLLEFSAGYISDHKLDYYISPNLAVDITIPKVFMTFAYKLMLETTAFGERNWLNGSIQRYTDTLAARHRLNSFTIAAGPSTCFFLKSSNHNRDILPYLDNHKAVKIFADLGLGYYFHTPDIQINMALRTFKSRLQAYGATQTAQRMAVTLEAYKFFADYHGFCPFIGPAISFEKLNVEEEGMKGNNSSSFKGVKPGLIVGWDIRPNRILSWYLRTNIRYFPNMAVRMDDGKKIHFDQLEVNFIQLVILPERFRL